MSVAVFGAGAVGCWHGALLARAGETVVLIGRDGLVAAVGARGGLLLEMGGRQDLVPLRASADPAAVAGADLVLVTVKAPDTAAAGAALAPHLAPGAVVLSLQNGIGNAGVLAQALGRPVLPCVVYVAVAMAGPGHVLHRGRGELVLADGPGAEGAARRLAAAGVVCTVSDQAGVALWVKLTLNCAVNALSALTRQPYGVLLDQPGAEGVLAAIVAECRSVAAAEGVALPPDMLAQVLALMRAMPGQLSSTAQDVIAGKRTEIAALNGEIARRGEALGIPVPLNRALTLMVGALGAA